MSTVGESWKTKPTDRFVLKWIKVHLSARLSPGLAGVCWLEPWMITVGSAAVGVTAGAVFALGWGAVAGVLALIAQILDGVDGQVARLAGKESRAGAFLDSVLDRYPDGAMMIGMTVFALRWSAPIPEGITLVLGFLALVGSNLISYSTARAEGLGFDLGRPTLASKGTRMTVMALAGAGSWFWSFLPLVALVYLAIHANLVVINRIRVVWKADAGR